MNPAQLLTQFDRISEVPDAIPRLRRFILDLAVRGKLVEQDPKDEPASELLKRIQAEKARMVKGEGNKRGKPLPKLSEDERPFELPHGWSWARFGEVYSLEYGDNLPKEKRSNTGEYPVYGSNGIVGTHSVCFVNGPCIVVGRKGSAGALNLSLTKGCCVTDVAYYCIPPRDLDLVFSFKLFHSLGLDILGKGIKPGLNRNEAYVLTVALPPFAEQHRIVAKVDELMVLCDQLEAAQGEGEIRRDRVVAASMHGLNIGGATAFRDNAHFYLNHLPRLTIRPEHIQQLRQTILNLAVTGRLTVNEQDGHAAHEELMKVEAKKRELALRRPRIIAPVSLEEQWCELPQGWLWVRWDQITDWITYGFTRPMPHTREGIAIVTGKNVNFGKIIFTSAHRTTQDAMQN